MEALKLSVSKGNSKMGNIPSVSLPAGETCRKDAPCFKKCYARRLSCFRKLVKSAYYRNLNILKNFPALFWRQVESVIMISRFFRYHVSGDIVNREYFQNMVDIAKRNPYNTSLCFTKQYDIVNKFLDEGNEIPENLQVLFSKWPGLKMENPYNLPEAHVMFKDGTTTARKDAKHCPGNCLNCALHTAGCWGLKKGEQVVIDEH